MKVAALLIAAAAGLMAQDHPVEGNAKSAVRVIAYEDLQCPDCAVYRKMLDAELLPKYGRSVAFEHRDFPLAKHVWARRAAVAARHCDGVRASLGVEFRQYLMAHQKEITADNFDARISEWASSHGVDPGKLRASAQDPALAKLVEEDYQEGVARGVARTPTVFVNGEPFIETFTVAEISTGIEAALKSARAR